jgi:hypothetical protein
VVWEAGTWAEIVKPYGHKPATWRFLPPGGDTGLSPESRRLRHLVARLCPSRVILSLASSGDYLVTSNEEQQRRAGDSRLDVWRIADGERTAEVVLGPSEVYGFAVDPVVSPDGRWLSACMHGDPIQIQDARLSPIAQMQFARVADPKQSYTPWRRLVWDLAGAGSPVDVLTYLYPILGSWFSPDGRLLLVSDLMEEGLRVWDCAARRFLWKANGGASPTMSAWRRAGSRSRSRTRWRCSTWPRGRGTRPCRRPPTCASIPWPCPPARPRCWPWSLPTG